MELRQLRYFVAIAEERHFGRAADRLQISTPTLSQQLKVLERGLGVVLVDRTRPGALTLTASGDVLLEHARILLTRADRARDEVRDAATQPEQIVLRVAPGAELLLARQLRRLTEDPTSGVVTMLSCTSDALLAVREESGDAAVVWNGRAEAKGLRTAVLQEVAVHLALSVGHRLAGAACVDVSDLADESIVMFPRALSPGIWDLLHSRLLPGGLSRPEQIIIEPNAIAPVGVARLVAAGTAVAPVIAALAQRAPHDGVVLRPLCPPLALPLELVWREPFGRALGRVLDYLRAECPDASSALDV